MTHSSHGLEVTQQTALLARASPPAVGKALELKTPCRKWCPYGQEFIHSAASASCCPSSSQKDGGNSKAARKNQLHPAP